MKMAKNSIWIVAAALMMALTTVTEVQGNRYLIIHNLCDYTVWPAIAGNTGNRHLMEGGFKLEPVQTSTIYNVPDDWSGRIWGRTRCNFTEDGTGGECMTGDCRSGLQCRGAVGVPPATVLEMNLSPDYSQLPDFYSVSLLDGFNVPLSMSAPNGDCRAECFTDINDDCPGDLQVTYDDEVIGCRSACVQFGKPQYCCTGEFVDNCEPSRYSRAFKDQCPLANTYPQDDQTVTCRNKSNAYDIVFCPEV